jgi:hypothetical protein
MNGAKHKEALPGSWLPHPGRMPRKAYEREGEPLDICQDLDRPA